MKTIDGKQVERWEDMQGVIQKSADKKLAITVEREGKPVTLEATPKLSDQKDPFVGDRVGMIGVKPAEGQPVTLGIFCFDQGRSVVQRLFDQDGGGSPW